MSSSHEAIKRVIEAFERSDWSEVDVRVGDVRVHLSTSAPPAGRSATTVNTAATTEPAPPAPAVTADDARPTGDECDLPAAADESRAVRPAPPGAHLVASPSPGIFWRSPEPGLPPFTGAGQLVEPSSTVCIVEVMKLMSHVKAGVRGEVVAVYGQNGTAVQKGEPLFAIIPDGSDS